MNRLSGRRGIMSSQFWQTGDPASPLPEESLNSWWARAAGQYGLNTQQMADAINQQLEGNQRYVLNDLVPPHADVARAIAGLVSVRTDTLRSLYLPQQYVTTTPHQQQPWEPRPTSLSAHRLWLLPSQHTTYCPLCLSSDSTPYFRRSWRLKTSVICTQHGRPMQDVCPHCSARPGRFRHHISDQGCVICQFCGGNLTQVKGVKRSVHYTETVERLARAVLMQPVIIQKSLMLFPETLNNFDYAGCFLDWAMYGDDHLYNHYASVGEKLHSRHGWSQMTVAERGLCIQSFHNFVSSSRSTRDPYQEIEGRSAFWSLLSRWQSMGVRFNPLNTPLRGQSNVTHAPDNFGFRCLIGQKVRFEKLDDTVHIIYAAWTKKFTGEDDFHIGLFDNTFDAFEACRHEHASDCSVRDQGFPFFNDIATNLWYAICSECRSRYYVTASEVLIRHPRFEPL